MKLEERYLSSKIDHIKGNHDLGKGRTVPYENYTLVINFVSGEKPNLKSRTYREEFATHKEAKVKEGKALSIINKHINY